MRTALLIIDIQNDYFPGGRNELAGSEEASRQARKLLEAFRLKKLPVFHVQHISNRAGATFFLPGTEGCEIHDNVRPVTGETVIAKHYPNSFRDTDLLDQLKAEKVVALVICGMMTHMCVDSTTRAAYDYGYSCILANDACATKNLTLNGETLNADIIHKSFLSALNGMFAVVRNTADVIRDMEKI